MATQALMGQSGPSFDAKQINPTPNYLDRIVVEVGSRKLENYEIIAYGTAHPDTTLFPGYQLVWQNEQTEEQFIRYYAAPRAGQDAYNYGVSYVEESNAHPIYPRDYIVRRADYAVIAKLTADPVYPAALLVKEDMLPKTGDERIDSLYVLVRRIYQTLPGPVLTGHQRSPAVRGRTVDVTIQEAQAGALAVETGDLVLESTVDPLTSVIDRRTTKKVSELPPTEVTAFWEWVPIPLLLFDITETIYCNNTQYGTIVTNPVKSGGASALRKHRKTVSYHTTLPDPDLSGSAYATAAVEYGGKFIKFDYGNVLNDAISYSQDVFTSSGDSACGWTEAYSFSATSPSATAFAAGDWYVRSYQVEPWGDSGWKATLIEFYSAPGNPSIS